MAHDPHDLAGLRAAIVARFGSVHTFAARTGMSKGLVYLVLKGTYPGNVAKQVARIRAHLEGRTGPLARVLDALRGAACGRCSVRTKTGCNRCDSLFAAQADAVLAAGIFSN